MKNIILFLCVFTLELNAQVNYSDYLETNFKLFWHNPVRAHPGVPLDFRYSVYEKDNQILTWELITAPTGMTLNQAGEVDWTATTQDIGTYQIKLKVTREDGDFIEREFSLTVGTSDFLFVATDGSDSNNGSINSPYKTIEYAMRQIQNSVAKTIYVRGGIYQEAYNWNVSGTSGPFRGQDFSELAPMVIRSYPNENMILDCNFQGHGFWAFQTSYVVFSNLEVRNAGAGERAGIQLSDNHNIAKDTTVRDGNWSSSNNVTGYRASGSELLIDRSFAFDNLDTDRPDSWNSSNYLTFASNGTRDDFIYIMNSESTGTVAGFKIKHGGPKRVIFHNNLSYGDSYGFGVASNFSSVRHCVSIDNNDGIFLAMTDPTTGGVNFTDGSMLIEQNTIVNPGSRGIVNPVGTYLAGGSFIQNNIVVNNVAAGLSIHIRPSVTASKNLFFGTSQDNVVRVGGPVWAAGTNYDFSQWQAISPSSVWGDPLFSDLLNNIVNIPENSPANYGAGEYAGAFKPTNTHVIFKNSYE